MCIAIPVSGRNAVLCVHISSGAEDIDAVQSITRHSEVELVVKVDGHQESTRVLHVHLIQHHVREWLEERRGKNTDEYCFRK